MGLFARLLTVIAFNIALSACAMRVPEPAGVPLVTPHLSWVIMHGDRDNPDAQFACQSDPRTECVIPASRTDAPVLSVVYIYYHGAGSETKYVGSVLVAFFQGAGESRGASTSITVRGKEGITNQSFTGIVTETPGRYALTFALAASLKDASASQPIREDVSVFVK